MNTDAHQAGILVETPERRLAVQPDGQPLESLYGLHCGDPLEVWDDVRGEYRPGRIEHTVRGGWYWTDNMFVLPLRPGMKARGYVG